MQKKKERKDLVLLPESNRSYDEDLSMAALFSSPLASKSTHLSFSSWVGTNLIRTSATSLRAFTSASAIRVSITVASETGSEGGTHIATSTNIRPPERWARSS